MAKASSEILSRLDILAAKQGAFGSEFPGIPYVAADGAFGVKCGNKRGGLYAAYFMLEKLAEGGLFAGKTHEGTDLDAAVYTLAPGKPFQIYDEAKLFWNSDLELQLEIKTDKPKAKILEAIETGIESADRDIQRRNNEKRAWEEKVAADKRREAHAPVFSPEEDVAFVRNYLKEAVNAIFPNAKPSVRYGIAYDGRPELVVSYIHPKGTNYAPDNDFVNYRLTEVFTGICAVGWSPMVSPLEERREFYVAGNPSRLAADIVDSGKPAASLKPKV